jgi:hypothetical protein
VHSGSGLRVGDRHFGLSGVATRDVWWGDKSTIGIDI